MLNYNSKICFDFNELARFSWEWLFATNINKNYIREDSLTDFNLFMLKSRNPRQIQYERYDGIKENTVGADWEWWLGEKGSWLGFRVQAKKLNPRYLNYSHLFDKDNAGRRQIDVLISEAAKVKPKPLVPLYVFYNSWDTLKLTPKWLCRPKDTKLLGCTVAYADTIRQANQRKTSKKLIDLRNYMYPWSCLVCCKKYQTGDLLPQIAAGFLSHILQQDSSRTQSNLIPDITPATYITSEPPSYVFQISEGTPIRRNQWHDIPVSRILTIQL